MAAAPGMEREMSSEDGMETPKALEGKEVQESGMADYFGLQVEIVAKMEEQSLIQYQDRKFIVDTKDLA